MIKLYNLDFCRLEIHHNYMKAVMNEGIVVSSTHNSILIKIAEKHFINRPFVYISHRIHSFAVNPIIHIRTSKIHNLAGFAVVSKEPVQKIQTNYEKTFFKKEFRRFDDMESALVWKDIIIKKYNNPITLSNKQTKRIK